MSTLSPLRLPVTDPTPGTRRRSCWGILLTGTTGCAAFLVGALVAGLLLSPRIFSPYLARELASDLDACLAGDLSNGSARLAWTKPVRLHGVSLEDASGAELLSAELVLPGMLELLGDPGAPTVVHANRPDASGVRSRRECALPRGARAGARAARGATRAAASRRTLPIPCSRCDDWVCPRSAVRCDWR
jgi:hypothetical protein